VANMESINDANDFDFHHAKAEQPRKPRMLKEDGTFSDKAPVPGMATTKEIDAWEEAQMSTNPDVAAMDNGEISSSLRPRRLMGVRMGKTRMWRVLHVLTTKSSHSSKDQA